eukprot:Nitzschia sp. Nitz4//scaffold134_size62860//6967//7728//NITZ4_006320-RA/size62860-processed-gene-0.42-mRNA-1//-1//CDS//3329535472//7052//frame0
MTPATPRLSTSNLLHQIRSILTKPKVCVQQSTLPSGGRGVFCSPDTPLPAHTVVALYPGVYTPPMPASAISIHDQDHIDVSTLYLASIQSPSGIPSEENAYLLNLATTNGGYLDGMALTCPTTGRPLDAHPSAVGHLLNHNHSIPNVSVISFPWETILSLAQVDTSSSSAMDETWSIPNVLRCDGSPWYWDTQESRLVRFPTSLSTEFLTRKSCGAAMVLSREVEPGEELFLDYGLRTNPLPAWAEGWYVPNA